MQAIQSNTSVHQTRKPTMPSGRIPSLDGLRAISIIYVVIFHLFSYLFIGGKIEAFPACILYSVIKNGRFGVLVFFVISGFLITYLLIKEQERTSTISLKGFYIRRIFRIFPAYYTLLALIAVLSAVGIFNVTPRALAHAATFTWMYVFSDWSWYLGHTWSLSVEEQFYLFWPAAFVLLGLRRARWVAFAILLLVPSARVLFTLPGSKLFHHICLFFKSSDFDVLMCGCLAALFSKSARLQRWLRQRYAGAICISAALIAFCVSASQYFFPNALFILNFSDTIAGLGVAAALLYVVANPKSFVGRILNLGPLVWIGVLSYSLYLWQQIFLTPERAYWFQRLPFNLLFTFLAAILSYYLIERPMIRFRERAFPSRRSQKA